MKRDRDAFSTSLADNLVQLFSLEGRTALVTGAASGLGKRVATVLAAAGSGVYFGDINEEGAANAAAKAKPIAGGDARSLFLDVTDKESVETAFGRIRKEVGGPEILICCAGISGGKWIEEMSLKMWREVLEVNLTGTFLCCKEALTSMVPGRWGRIINIASIAASHAPKPKRFDGGYNYSASKAGVIGMTKRLAPEIAPYNITANCLSPGIMRTPLTENALADEQTLKEVLELIPMHRLATPSDLDGLVVFLCSESSSFITGQDIIVDGGYSVW